MNDPFDHSTWNGLEAITSELRTIRRLLTALLIGVVILIGALIHPEISVSLAIAGFFSGWWS